MMPPDRVLSIDTPENVVFGYELAGLGSRFLAAVVDSFIIVVLLLFLTITQLAIANAALANDISATAWVFAIFILLDFITIWAYYIVFELVWNGQSPGKRLTKLRVMQAEGRPVTLTGSMLRNLVRFIDFLPIFYGVGVIAMFISKQSRRLGDFAGGTLVVYDHSIVSLHQLAAWQPSVTERLFRDDATQQLSLPIEKLDASDIALAEELLLRGPSLTTHNELAASVLRKLYADMDVEMDIVGYDSTMKRLKSIVLAYRHLNEADYEEVSAESGSGVGVGKANP
ncbi:MAG: RDD family protein [Anaerolineae bacterium]|nr:RDD family protein [Anaerolineae bacterium]